MKILLTGFEPFGGETINPAYEVLKLIPDNIDGHDIIKREIPTSYKSSIKAVGELLESEKPDVVLSLGQAAGAFGLRVEKVGLNLRDANSPDNDDHRASHEVIFEGGETAYYASLPVKAIVKKLRENNIPANVSYSAGAYVCNNLLYALLYLNNKKYENMRCGFIHVPFFPEQIMGKNNIFYMTPDEMRRGIVLAVKAIIENKVDIDFIT
ncbi:MAG: pyroglutamyl-peptidase I [Defluviitaleaceae bacterium]|nr:pyroglutamyl-peptidase I [Defluviitaleaceae bacterium]